MTPPRDYLAWLIKVCAAGFVIFVLWALILADQPPSDRELRRDVTVGVCQHDANPAACAIVLWEGGE